MRRVKPRSAALNIRQDGTPYQFLNSSGSRAKNRIRLLRTYSVVVIFGMRANRPASMPAFGCQRERHHLYRKNFHDGAHARRHLGQIPCSRTGVFGNPPGLAASLANVIQQPGLQRPRCFCSCKNHGEGFAVDHLQRAVAKRRAAHAFRVQAYRFLDDQRALPAAAKDTPRPSKNKSRTP